MQRVSGAGNRDHLGANQLNLPSLLEARFPRFLAFWDGGLIWEKGLVEGENWKSDRCGFPRQSTPNVGVWKIQRFMDCRLGVEQPTL